MRSVFLIIALAFSIPLLSLGETIDRVVAVVNAHAILLSEWDTAARLEVLLDHKPFTSITDATRHATLDRMIDQELLRGEMENSSVTRSSSEDVAAKLKEVRQQFPNTSTDQQWSTLLAQYGVTETEVEVAVTDELDGLRLLDFRLRSTALPDPAQIERYYHSVYEPAMRAKRARPAPLPDVVQRIREILTQQKLTELTTTWLQTLRSQANIQMNVQFADAVPQDSQPKPPTSKP